MFLADAASDHNLLTDLTIGQLLGMAVTVAAVVAIIVKINPLMKKLNQFFGDWFGEPERPGVEGRLGAMERLSEQDKQIAEIKESIAPVVDMKAEGNHRQVLARLSDIQDTVDRNRGHTHRVERLLVRHIKESRKWVADVTEKAKQTGFETPPWPQIDDDDTRED